MEKTNLILFNVDESCDFHDDCIRQYKGSSKLNVYSFSDPRVAQMLISKTGNAIFVFQIRGREDLKNAIILLKANKKLQRKNLFKSVCVTDIKNKKVESILARNGCLELVDPNVKFKTLNYKLDFWARPIANALKTLAAKQSYALKKKTQETEKKEANKKEFASVAALENQPADFWIIKSRFDYKKVLKSYLVRVLGPSPHIGKWHELESDEGDEFSTWKYVVHNPDGESYITDDGAWFFVGSKPEFDWKIKRWIFSSKRPHLYFYNTADEVYSRFKFDDGQVKIADNSKQALKREDDIFETCTSDFSFAGDAAEKEDTERMDGDGSDEKLSGRLEGNNEEEVDGFNHKGNSKTDNIDSGQLAGDVASEARGRDPLRGKGHTDRVKTDPLSGKYKTDDVSTDPLAGNIGSENHGRDPLGYKSKTDNIDSGQLAGDVASEAHSREPLKGRGQSDRVNRDPLRGKSNTDDVSTNPLAGNIASEAHGKDPLKAKGQTDRVNRDPLSRKSKTDDVSSDPLAGDVASEAHGKDPLKGKGQTDRVNRDPLSRKSKTDDVSSDPLAGDVASEAHGKDPLKAKGQTDRVNRDPLSRKSKTDDVSSDPLAGDVASEAHGKDPLKGKGQTDRVNRDPLSRKSKTDDLSTDPLAGDVASEAHGKDPLKGKSQTDRVNRDPLSRKSKTDDLSTDPLAGDVASEAHGKDPLKGKSQTDRVNRDPLSSKAKTDDMSSDPLAGDVASEAHGKDPLKGRAKNDAVSESSSKDSNTEHLRGGVKGSVDSAGDISTNLDHSDPLKDPAINSSVLEEKKKLSEADSQSKSASLMEAEEDDGLGPDPLAGTAEAKNSVAPETKVDSNSELDDKDGLPGDPLVNASKEKNKINSKSENKSEQNIDAGREKSTEQIKKASNTAQEIDDKEGLPTDPLASAAQERKQAKAKGDKRNLPRDPLTGARDKPEGNSTKSKKPVIREVKVSLNPEDLEGSEAVEKDLSKVMIGLRKNEGNKRKNKNAIQAESRDKGSKEYLEEEMAEVLDGGFTAKNDSEKESTLIDTQDDDDFLESGILRVIINTSNNKEIICELIDLYSKELTVRDIGSHVKTGERIEVKVTLSYSSNEAEIVTAGVVEDIEKEDGAELVTIKLSNFDEEQFSEFMELYEWRQENITNFMKQAKGY